MNIGLFEQDYGDLADSDHAVKVFGTKVPEGVATVGDIRKLCSGKPKDASICIQRDGWGFYVAAFEGNALLRSRQPAPK
ncbi:MAG TPA: hypothetical protein VGI45_26670 [Terracidiphilus sp.]